MEVYCYITAPYAVEDAFLRIGNQVDDGATLYVPKGKKEAYESTVGWYEFANIVEMDDETVGIDGVAAGSKVPVVYTLCGRKLSTLSGQPHGIYVVDGKKIVR